MDVDKVADIMKGNQILKRFIKENLVKYIFGILILIAAHISASTIPKFIGSITDGLNDKNMHISEVYQYIYLILGVSVAVFLLKFGWRYLLIGNCRKLEVYLRAELFKHLQSLSMNFYNNNKTGDLVAYAINDIQAVRFTFGMGFISILELLTINSVAIFFMAKTISPILTLMALAPVPAAVFFMLKLGTVIRERFTRVQEAFSAISEKVQENISGIRVIKAFAQEKEEVENFKKYSDARVKTQMKLTAVSSLLGSLTQISFGISFLLFIIYGSELVVKGVISLGDYVAFNSYMLIIIGPISNISRIIEVWQRGLASIKRLNEIFDQSSEIIEADNVVENERFKGKIEIRNLNFSYPGTQRRALRNVNVTLDAGKTLGILGGIGSGKSTIVNLLIRLYSVGDDRIFIDDIDINQIPLDSLRESIGYVPQENFLFSTTIRSNIEFFRPIYSDDEVIEAARQSGVHDNIMAFPDGFDTVVGERGVTLSGGQKQRISIARAIIKNPSILILDDSFSAVDTKTEEEILSNIKSILGSRTGILISHRVSTVMHADMILFMEKGKVIEKGTHEELLNAKGHYYNLYVAQLEKKEELEENFGHE